ncbi:unnamed protein product [Eruca vesicaria subsp. sativa]|uniref:RRM domain-containing protein n=1 Tax=Eruca vesicaria subsp. sativa TaxID=29727 RepID=A0ABC8LFI3_ERUVS|nr:unnamed protein product [Eruca vesicaria subsp. sativa]
MAQFHSLPPDCNFTLLGLGSVSGAVVMIDGDGRSRKKFDDKEWYVGKAQKKSEREVELSRRYEQGARETGNSFDGLNLYVKNLDDTVTDEKLRELFAEFGTITSCKGSLVQFSGSKEIQNDAGDCRDILVFNTYDVTNLSTFLGFCCLFADVFTVGG